MIIQNKLVVKTDQNDVKTTYEIKGTVWLESEKDGEREASEKKVSE